MARYKVLETTFDAKTGTIAEPGTEIEFDGVPGANLEPLDKEAKAAVEAKPEPEPDIDKKAEGSGDDPKAVAGKDGSVAIKL